MALIKWPVVEFTPDVQPTVIAPGEARSDLWQLMEFSKRFKMEEVWPAELLAKTPAYRGKTLYDVLFRNGQVNKFPASEMEAGYENTEAKSCGFYVQKGLFEEYAQFGRGHGHDLAPFDTYHQVRGLRWPVVNGKETLWRYREGADPYVKPGTGFQFYGHPDGKALIFALPYEPPPEVPDKDYPVLAVDRPRAGALAFGLDDAPRAGAARGGAQCRVLHASRTMPRRSACGAASRWRSARGAAACARASRRAAATSRRGDWCSCRGSTRAS